jgi:hypothetical protein
MKTIKRNSIWVEETRIGTIMILIVILSMLFAGKASAAPTTTAANTNNCLESCSADCNNFNAVIKWSTTSDMGNTVFTVDRTRDGVHFEIVATLTAVAGDSKHEYSVVDETPMSGVYYYRISDCDSTGKTTYLNMVAYTPCENDQVIEAFNTGRELFIQVNAPKPDSTSIVLKDMKGNVVISEKRKVSLGLNNFSLKPSIEKGVYVLSIKYGKYKLNKVLALEPAVAKQ